MAGPLIENVSDTAFWVAHYRALETARADALFHDPLAGLLAGERGKTIAASMPMSFFTAWTVVIRTCIIDDYIRFALAQGVDTVLNLGAGLDTRPYRMEIPESLTWIEADYPQIIELKERRLAGERPRCRLERLKLDLTNLALRREVLASLDARAMKMLVLTEGFVPYLSVAEAGSLADDLMALEHACYWIVDYFSPMVLRYRRRRWNRRRVKNIPFKFNPKDWSGFFGEHGWRSREIRYLAEEARRLHCPVRLPWFFRILFKIRRLFVSKARRALFRKFVGYALLEPAATASGNPA